MQGDTKSFFILTTISESTLTMFNIIGITETNNLTMIKLMGITLRGNTSTGCNFLGI